MGDYDYDPKASRNPSAFKRLTSGSAEDSGAATPKKAAAGSLPIGRIFNQVQFSSTAQGWEKSSEPHLGRLQSSVEDLKASTATLFSLSDASREVREANIGASAASVKEVEASARLAEDVGRRIVGDNQSATDAHAGKKLTAANVERLLRS
jgi:hypothetical protein